MAQLFNNMYNSEIDIYNELQKSLSDLHITFDTPEDYGLKINDFKWFKRRSYIYNHILSESIWKIKSNDIDDYEKEHLFGLSKRGFIDYLLITSLMDFFLVTEKKHYDYEDFINDGEQEGWKYLVNEIYKPVILEIFKEEFMELSENNLKNRIKKILKEQETKKYSEQEIEDMKNKFMGTYVTLKNKDGEEWVGKVNFLGYNPHIPDWGFQVTLGRTPIRHVDPESIVINKKRRRPLPKDYKKLFSEMPKQLKELLFQQWGAKQNPKWHPEGNSLKHILIVIKRAYAHYPDDPNMILTALFHDLGKMDTYAVNPKTGQPTAYGHEDKSEMYVEKFKDWVESYEGTDVDEIKFLVKNHMKIKPSTWDSMKDAKKEPITSHPAFEKLRGFTDKLDGGGTKISETDIRRLIKKIINL